jgi:hypothetical protein
MSNLLNQNKPELYNRISCRSPLRKTNRINQDVKHINLSNVNNLEPKVQMNQEMKSESKQFNNRVSCRSIKRQIKPEVHDCTYKVITKTPSGQTVDFPTTYSFIKFKTPSQPNKIYKPKIEYIELNKKIKYNFSEALDLFENNQSYILEQIESQCINETLINQLKQLNSWFNKIKEPKPTDVNDIKEWKEREKFKKDNHYSIYLDKDLIPYLS